MCQRFVEHLSDAELARVLTVRHHIEEQVSGEALVLNVLDCERSRLRDYITSLAEKDGMAARIISQYLSPELPERPRR